MNTVIEALNQTVEELRTKENIQSKGHFVFKKTIIPDAKYPVYKLCTFELYYVLDKTKDKIISVQDNIRISDNVGTLRDLEIKFYKELFMFIFSDKFKNYIFNLFI